MPLALVRHPRARSPGLSVGALGLVAGGRELYFASGPKILAQWAREGAEPGCRVAHGCSFQPNDCDGVDEAQRNNYGRVRWQIRRRYYGQCSCEFSQQSHHHRYLH